MLGSNERCYPVLGTTVNQKLQTVRHTQPVRHQKNGQEMTTTNIRGHTRVKMLGMNALLGAKALKWQR